MRVATRLAEVELVLSDAPLPERVSRLITSANENIAALEDQSRAAIPAFVPSDFELVYRALVAIKSGNLTTGRRFLEWGSGIGVVACLGVYAGFDSAGIEIEPRLVEIAERLARSHRLAAQFVCGNFMPHDATPLVEFHADVNWLSTGGTDGYAELELEPDDFDLVFAYPWPGEEQVLFDLFADFAAVGALLLTYHGQEGLRAQRKMRR